LHIGVPVPGTPGRVAHVFGVHPHSPVAPPPPHVSGEVHRHCTVPIPHPGEIVWHVFAGHLFGTHGIELDPPDPDIPLEPEVPLEPDPLPLDPEAPPEWLLELELPTELLPAPASSAVHVMLGTHTAREMPPTGPGQSCLAHMPETQFCVVMSHFGAPPMAVHADSERHTPTGAVPFRMQHWIPLPASLTQSVFV